MVKGEVTHELDLGVPSNAAWELYGTLGMAKLAVEKIPAFSKVNVVHGDGGLGTILHVFLAPGAPGFSEYKEKFTLVDNEKRVKEVEVVEGGYLDIGFTLYRLRFEIIDAGHSSCIIKTTIQYELNDDYATNVSFTAIDGFAGIALLAREHLKNQQATLSSSTT